MALPVSLSGRRVAVVAAGLSQEGGTEVYLRRLLQAQRELGLEVCLVTAEPAVGIAVAESVVRPVVFAEAPAWPRRRAPPGVPTLADELVGWADWVEFHHGVAPDLPYALQGRLPSLLFMHTARHTCAARGRYLPRSGQCCGRSPGLGCWWGQWRDGCLTTIDGRPSLAGLLAAANLGRSSRAMATAITRLVFNSAALLGLFRRTVGGLADKARLLPPPMLMPPIPPTDARKGHLLYLGRFFEQKGILDAVRVAATLGRELRLHGAGRGEVQARQLAEALGVAARFHPWSGNADIARALAGAGCLLLPTRFFEAWGMVGPEAIAQGCPVAAYDSGGIREWLDAEYGECVPQGDVAALAAAARRQLARVEAGLDSSPWRQAMESRWGMAAFTGRYARLAGEILAMREG